MLVTIHLDGTATNTHKPTMKELKHHIKSAWRFRCAKCLSIFSENQLTMGHMVPESRGGLRCLGNLVPVCQPCNQKDKDRLVAYKQVTTKGSIGPDDAASRALVRLSHETCDPIHGQVNYVDIPLGRSVMVNSDVDDPVLQSRRGKIHSADMGVDKYYVDLEKPFAIYDGFNVEIIEQIVLRRSDFEYSESPIQAPPPTIDFAFKYREYDTEIVCTGVEYNPTIEFAFKYREYGSPEEEK